MYFRTEQILEIECPECGAKPGRFCDRKGDWLSREGRRLLAEGTPPSHTERMWLRQGHLESEFGEMRAKNSQPGSYQAKSTKRGGVTGIGWDASPARPGSARASGYGL